MERAVLGSRLAWGASGFAALSPNRGCNQRHKRSYVDLNPVRAGIAEKPEHYRWSSAAAHLSGADAARLLDTWELERWGGCQDWASRLDQAVGASEADLLRRATASGAAFGEPAFVSELAQRSGQDLELRSCGRPRKTSTAAGTA